MASHDGTAAPLRYRRQDVVLSASLGADEVALLDGTRETYYGLKGTGRRIWELLAEPRSLDDIVSVLREDYEVDEATCRGDTRELIEQLVAKGLVALHP